MMFTILKTSNAQGQSSSTIDRSANSASASCVSTREFIYGVIAKLNGMLETDQFVDMCRGLMHHTDTHIKNNVLTHLADKVVTEDPHLFAQYISATKELVVLTTTRAVTECRQNALLCLSVMVKTFGKEDTARYLQLFGVGVDILGEEGLDENVFVSCITLLSLLTYIFNTLSLLLVFQLDQSHSLRCQE